MLIPLNNHSPSITLTTLQELCATSAVQLAPKVDVFEGHSSSLLGRFKHLEDLLSQFLESFAAYEGNRLQKKLLVSKMIRLVEEPQNGAQLFVDKLEGLKGDLSKVAAFCEGLYGDSFQSLIHRVSQVLRTAKEVQRNSDQSLEKLKLLKASF